MKGAFVMKGGAGIRFFKKQNVVKAEQTLFALLQPHIPERPLEGPLKLTVLWSFPWRSSEPKREREKGVKLCDVRPDLSNIVKLLEDTMTTMRFWHDDGQIADLQLSKVWGDWSGLVITVEEMSLTASAPTV